MEFWVLLGKTLGRQVMTSCLNLMQVIDFKKLPIDKL